MKKAILTLALVAQFLIPSAFADDNDLYNYFTGQANQVYSNVDSTGVFSDLLTFDTNFQDAYLTTTYFNSYAGAKSSLDAFYATVTNNLNYKTASTYSQFNSIIDGIFNVSWDDSYYAQYTYDTVYMTYLDNLSFIGDIQNYATGYATAQNSALRAYWPTQDNNTPPVPEPSTYGLFLGLGALGFVAIRRKKLAA